MSRSLFGRGRVAAATLLLGVAMAMTSCSGGGETPPKEGGGPAGSFSVGMTSFFVAHLMPGNSGGSNVNNALFTPLTRLDPATGKIVNAVASSVESTDQKVWTIVIADGWTFHNGDPVTAQSFADSWNATANPKNAMTGSLELAVIKGYAQMNPASGKPTATELSGVEVVDEHTLKVTLDQPSTLFPSTMSSTVYAPIPTQASKDFAAFDLNPIGNGPFMVTGGGVKPGSQEVVLKAYPDYAGEKAKTESLTIKSYQDSTAIYTDFQSGAIDLALVDGGDLSAAKKEFPDQVVEVNYPAVVYLGFPTWDPRFENVKLRQALSMAIDRQSIVDALLKGNAQVADGVAPSSLPGGGQHDCKACALDVAGAKVLLAEAGGFSGKLTLYSYSDPTNSAVLDAIANQLRSNLGIEAVAETQPVDQLYKNFTDETLEGAFLLYSGTNVPHLYGEVNALFIKTSALNATHYSSTEVSGLLAQALASPSTEKFTSLVQQASSRALADLPLAPLYYPVGGLLYSKKLSGVQPELLGGADLSKVTVSG